MRSGFSWLALLALSVSGCDCGGDDSSPGTCGSLGAACCAAAPACQTGLACVTEGDAMTCRALAADAGGADSGGPRPDAGGPGLDAGSPGLDAGGPGDAGTDAGVDAGPPDAGSCCDRLGTSTTAQWLASDGVLPEAACPAWAATVSATSAPAITGGVLVTETASDPERIYYAHAASEVTPGATVTIETRVRVVSGSSSTPSRGVAMIAAVLGPMRRKLYFQVEVGHIFLTTDENVRGPELAMDTTTAAHDYRVEVDVATGAVRVLVDGTLALTGSTFTDPDPSATNLVFWGPGSIFSHGRAEWSSFRYDAYGGCAAP